jgi:glutathione S-transferase
MDQHLLTSGWFAADRYTIADIACMPIPTALMMPGSTCRVTQQSNGGSTECVVSRTI